MIDPPAENEKAASTRNAAQPKRPATQGDLTPSAGELQAKRSLPLVRTKILGIDRKQKIVIVQTTLIHSTFEDPYDFKAVPLEYKKHAPDELAAYFHEQMVAGIAETLGEAEL